MVTTDDLEKELQDLRAKIYRAEKHGMDMSDKIAMSQNAVMFCEVLRRRFGLTSAYWATSELNAEKLYTEKYERENLFK